MGGSVQIDLWSPSWRATEFGAICPSPRPYSLEPLGHFQLNLGKMRFIFVQKKDLPHLQSEMLKATLVN